MGNNSYSQLGDKTLNNQAAPVQTKVSEWLNPSVLKPGEGTVIIKAPKVQSLTASESDTFVIKIISCTVGAVIRSANWQMVPIPLSLLRNP